jgi:outer membrane protein assembly factor BamB
LTVVTTRARPRRSIWRIILLSALLALLLVGCGPQVAPYWPALSVEGTGSDATVYVAQTSGQVFALNGGTGRVEWVYPATPERQGGLLSGCSPAAPSDGPFFSPPSPTEDALYLASAGEQQRSLFGGGENRSGLRVLNKLGTLQWENRESTDRSIASPALDDTTAYLSSSDQSVYAIDLSTRQPRWSFATESYVWATPLVIEDRIYVASMDHSLYAVDRANGARLWRFTGKAGALAASPVISDDADPLLYVSSLGGYVYAVRAETGEQVWEAEVEGGAWASPLLVQDGTGEFAALYVGTLSGFFYALDPQDGSEIWKQELPGEIRGTAAFVSAPAPSVGKVYVGCENGQLYTFDAQTGIEALSPLGQQVQEASLYSAPAFDGQHLYVVATDGRVYALDPERNAILWQANPLEQAGEDN